MSSFLPRELAEWTGGVWVPFIPSREINAFCHDSRILHQNEMFIAISTEKRDGHDFLQEACKKGALAALVEKTSELTLPQLRVNSVKKALEAIACAARRRFSGTVIGVTGSYGKTSTKDLLQCLLGKDVYATARNYNNFLGVFLTLTGIGSAHRYAVVEVGTDSPGELPYLAEIVAPDCAIVTGVGPVHLENFGSVEAVAHEKAALVKKVPRGGKVVFPRSCEVFEDFKCPGGIDYKVTHGSEGKSILSIKEVDYRFSLPAFTSDGMISNMALAIVLASHLGVTSSQIQERLYLWKPSFLRGETYSFEKQFYYVDCYNSNPVALVDALKRFDQMVSLRRRLYVLGSMRELGKKSASLHFEVGQQLRLDERDRVFLLGEHGEAFLRGLLQGGARRDQIGLFAHWQEVKSAVCDFEGAIFLKGSRFYGMENLLPKNLFRQIIKKC